MQFKNFCQIKKSYFPFVLFYLHSVILGSRFPQHGVCLSVEAGCERDALDGEESGLKVWKEVN